MIEVELESWWDNQNEATTENAWTSVTKGGSKKGGEGKGNYMGREQGQDNRGRAEGKESCDPGYGRVMQGGRENVMQGGTENGKLLFCVCAVMVYIYIYIHALLLYHISSGANPNKPFELLSHNSITYPTLPRLLTGPYSTKSSRTNPLFGNRFEILRYKPVQSRATAGVPEVKPVEAKTPPAREEKVSGPVAATTRFVYQLSRFSSSRPGYKGISSEYARHSNAKTMVKKALDCTNDVQSTPALKTE